MMPFSNSYTKYKPKTLFAKPVQKKLLNFAERY